MKRPNPAGGFTLIELMVVITVIVLLALMVFRLVSSMGKTNDIAESRAIVEKTANAVETYKRLWGTYPPVPDYDGAQPTSYEFPNKQWGWGSNPDSRAKQLKNFSWSSSAAKDKGVLFTFGLCSFFLPRYNKTADRGPTRLCGVGYDEHGQSGNRQYSQYACVQWQNFNRKVSGRIGDSEDDINKIRQILGALDGGIDEKGNINYGIIYGSYSAARPIETSGGAKFVVTNQVYGIRDAWYRDLRYVSNPPYSSYDLRSAGPDGKFDTDDDIVAGRTE